MLNQIANFTPGEKKSIDLLRDGKPQQIQIEIGIRPKPGDFLRK